jgi:hypothetical protein
MGTAPQHDILATQLNQLRNSEAGLHRDQKKRSITAPQPGGRIWNRKQRVDLFPVEKVNRPLFVTFVGHCQYPLAVQGMRGLL